MKKTKLEKGITLIALIITIVVLLILAVVTIGAIQESKIIAHAKNASTGYNDEKAKEESAIAGYESLIDSKLPGGNGGNIPPVGDVTILEAQADSMLSKTTNSITYDLYGNKIVVPAGFKILVDDTTGYNSENLDVTKGIVIQDEEGNEFVWVPVGENITNGTKTETIKLSRYKFDSTTGVATDAGDAAIDNYYQELATSSYGNATAKNLTGFLSSANTNKGYYIARYEAGVTGYDSTNMPKYANNSDKIWTGYVAAEGEELKLVSKYGQQVWDYITQNKASELCRNMYQNATTYTSDLINSYAWDTSIVFIQTFGVESDASKYSILNKCTGYRKTGVNSDKYCNIHDMSGNAIELSTESYCAEDYPCVYRGGQWEEGACYDCSDRNKMKLSQSFALLSFRPILYL